MGNLNFKCRYIFVSFQLRKMWEIVFFIGGYFVQAASSCLLIHKLRTTRSTYGLSVHTQILFFIATLVRFLWVKETRLMDTPLTLLEMFSSLITQGIILYYFWIYRMSCNIGHKEKPTRVWWPLRSVYLGLLAALLAILFHPGRTTISMQIMVAYTIYSESLALLPQLATMRSCIEVESITSNYVAILVGSRVIRLMFWLKLFQIGETF